MMATRHTKHNGKCGRCDRGPEKCFRSSAWVAWSLTRMRDGDSEAEVAAEEAYLSANDDCHEHAVDWRERCLAALEALTGKPRSSSTMMSPTHFLIVDAIAILRDGVLQ